MKVDDIHIGQKVIVRDYEDLADEFGKYCNSNSIDVGHDILFLEEMKYLCGNVYFVADIDRRTGRVELLEDKRWLITDTMLRPYEKEPKEGDQILAAINSAIESMLAFPAVT